MKKTTQRTNYNTLVSVQDTTVFQLL